MRVCNACLSWTDPSLRSRSTSSDGVYGGKQKSEGLGEVIGTARHYRMSPGLWRLAGLSGARQASECMLGIFSRDLNDTSFHLLLNSKEECVGSQTAAL